MNVWEHKRNKLAVTWCGPAVISGVSSEWIFEITNLVTGDVREAHASRLRFFDASLIDTSQDLLEHIAYNSEGHVIDKFHQVDKNADQEWVILVSWRGLERIEDSWEPIDVLLEDVPAQLKKWLRKNTANIKISEMCDDLGLSITDSQGDSDIQIHPFPDKKKKKKTKL